MLLIKNGHIRTMAVLTAFAGNKNGMQTHPVWHIQGLQMPQGS